MKFGVHLDLLYYLNSKSFTLNQSSFDKAYVTDALENRQATLLLRRPQDWSVSLTKALCLTEELFHSDCTAEVRVQRSRCCTDKAQQASNVMVSEADIHMMMISGEYIVKVYAGESEEMWS